MITKKQFKSFLENWNIYDEALDRISNAVTGKSFGCDLYDSDWNNAVGMMLDIFIDSHFTEEGADVINYYLFESTDKVITVHQEKDMFNEEKDIEYHLDSIDDLWDFLLTDKETYFLNA